MLRSSETRSAPPGASEWHPRNYFDRASTNVRYDLGKLASFVPGLRRVFMVDQAIVEQQSLPQPPVEDYGTIMPESRSPTLDDPQLALVEGLEALPHPTPTDAHVLAFLVGADAAPVLLDRAMQEGQDLSPLEPMVISGDVLALTTEDEAKAQLHVKPDAEAIVFPEAFTEPAPQRLHPDEEVVITMATLYLERQVPLDEMSGFIEQPDVPLAFGENKMGDTQPEQLIFLDTQKSISS